MNSLKGTLTGELIAEFVGTFVPILAGTGVVAACLRWPHRLRATNLAEGFFRHLRRYLGRFPGCGRPRAQVARPGLVHVGV